MNLPNLSSGFLRVCRNLVLFKDFRFLCSLRSFVQLGLIVQSRNTATPQHRNTATPGVAVLRCCGFAPKVIYSLLLCVTLMLFLVTNSEPRSTQRSTEVRRKEQY